jgi:hypothetical protein
MPVECPVCGRYNPAHWQKCKRCGAPVPQGAPQNKSDKTVRSAGRQCFLCDPLHKPLCKLCVTEGRVKICPDCGAYVLGTRKDCKACGHSF